MKNYDVRGTLLEGKKAVIAVVLPEPFRENIYSIYDIYNISDEKENKLVIHFKDIFGRTLEANGNYVSFIIDLHGPKFESVDFNKPVNVAFHHENGTLGIKTPQEIFDSVFGPIVTPDTTGKGTIREGA
ncbi:hypothetical protein [Flavobacterium sp.]|uniref:hypothetical protein n=1 Tax=Flavobacterium sp. TaxID=239 RepID=UPI003D0A205D